jgi:inner membrane protein
MLSIISHAAVAVAADAAFAPRGVPSLFWSFSIICSVIPDLDGIGFFFGIPYNHIFGHRGFLHSPLFGLLLSIFLVSIFFSNLETFSKQWFFYILFFFLLSSSHGIVDAFTNGGLGVAFIDSF